MAVLVHVGNRTFTLKPDDSADQLEKDIDAAVKVGGGFHFNAMIGDAPLSVWVNTAQVDTIVVDSNGVGSGFFSS